MKNKDVNQQGRKNNGKKVGQKGHRMSGDNSAESKIHRKIKRTSRHQI